MTSTEAYNSVEELVLTFYLRSASKESFNGLHAASPELVIASKGQLESCVRELVEKGAIDCIWDVNPHIKRFPEMSRDKQLSKIGRDGLEDACLYPSRRTLRNVVRDEDFRDKPFSRALLLGNAQLSFVAFEMAVLQRYRDDPRYRLSFTDYMGNTYISDEYYEKDRTLARDHIGVQSFGLGFDQEGLPHVIAFYRYLADMTPEHQQYWRSFTSEDPVRMSDPYFESSIVGDWWENRSARFAIAEEMRLINELATAKWGTRIFREAMDDNLTLDLTAFLVPSSEAFGRLVHTWDKLLSDNINKKFFDGKVCLTKEVEISTGRFQVTEKGTLTLLEEWLSLLNENPSEAAEILKPLRRVRKLRQKPAHTFSKNSFSRDFHIQRVNLLREIHSAVKSLRSALATAIQDHQVDIPGWLNDQDIHFF